MNIGIDLDDTIAKTAHSFFKYGRKFNKEKNIKFKIKRNEWDFDKAFGWTEIDIKNFFENYLEDLFNSVKPKKNAKKIIKILKNKGHKIIIITARSENDTENIYNITKNWFDKYNIKVDIVEVNSKDKVEKCINNNIDIFIDDRYLSL